jgi:hypothetical protein
VRLRLRATATLCLILLAFGGLVAPIALTPGFLVEDPVGVYNPAVAQALDALINAAEQHDIYLLICPYGTFYIRPCPMGKRSSVGCCTTRAITTRTPSGPG